MQQQQQTRAEGFNDWQGSQRQHIHLTVQWSMPFCQFTSWYITALFLW
jgi:hypothetical protein